LRNLVTEPQHAGRRAELQRALRAHMIETRDSGFIPEGMFDRLAGGKTLYDYVQSPAYPIERIVDLADKATSRDPRHLADLQTALSDSHPVIRYWAALGCVVLQQKAAAAKSALVPRLRDEWADVRIVAAEALGYQGESEAGVTTLAELVKSKQPYEALAALNTLEYMWRAGHVPLARVQTIVRELKLSEPGDRIPRYLLSLK
jgi:N-sulfoglucosamine sulfohydrolase